MNYLKVSLSRVRSLLNYLRLMPLFDVTFNHISCFILYFAYNYSCFVELEENWSFLLKPTKAYSAKNNSWPLAIFQPISTFGWPKSILVSQFYCTFSMGWQSIIYKMSYLQKTAYQFVTLISTTGIFNSSPSVCDVLKFCFIHSLWATGSNFTIPDAMT